VNRLLAAALDLQRFCRTRGWRFCFIGGLAVQRWGEPRLTQDADLTVITGFGSEAPFVDALLGQFRGRLPDTRDFALRTRVVLLRSADGVPLDVSLGAMPFEERAVARASDFEPAPGVVLMTCSAEDLIVYKAFAGRVQDWLDIEGIAVRQGARLDNRLIWAEVVPLLELKECPQDAGRLRTILDRART
jgi:hypothetical protein